MDTRLEVVGGDAEAIANGLPQMHQDARTELEKGNAASITTAGLTKMRGGWLQCAATSWNRGHQLRTGGQINVAAEASRRLGTKFLAILTAITGVAWLLAHVLQPELAAAQRILCSGGQPLYSWPSHL